MMKRITQRLTLFQRLFLAVPLLVMEFLNESKR